LSRPPAIQIGAEQQRGQAVESAKGPQHTLLIQGSGVANRELADDDADRRILGVDPPRVRVLPALETRDTGDHG
jgi:hypothetical protein